MNYAGSRLHEDTEPTIIVLVLRSRSRKTIKSRTTDEHEQKRRRRVNRLDRSLGTAGLLFSNYSQLRSVLNSPFPAQPTQWRSAPFRWRL